VSTATGGDGGGRPVGGREPVDGGPSAPGCAPVDLARGLDAAEAARRLARDGPNRLPAPRPPAAWRRLAAQMVHFFAVMLWVAAVLALVAGMPELALAIAVVVVVNGLFAFVQEHRAERAAERLRDLLPRRVTVRRDGVPVDVDADDLVVDDVVLLGAGDRVCADLRAAVVHGLSVDTSTLTGESVPSAVDVDEPVLAGTFVVEGEAVARVLATGEETRLAGIARLTRAGHRPPSPLARELERLVRTIAAVAVGVGVSFFVLSLLLGTAPSDGFLFAIGVTVALVPEGLLPTVTLALAVGAQRMAARHALVRRLESVETLGSTTFVCTDKTGTLTRNEMAVVEAWTPAGTATVTGDGYEPDGEVHAADEVRVALGRAATAAAACSSGRAVERDGSWRAQGDPMEAAVDVLARRLGVPPVGAGPRPTRRFPFDPRRRRMSVVADGRVLVKGAPDAVLPVCTPCPGAEAALHDLAARGLRVLAVAERAAGSVEPVDAGSAERDLTFLGVLALEDPPRPDAAASLEACRRAGIKVAMVTGDHPETARAVAREVGLLGPDQMVLVGADLPADEAVLGALLDRDGVVVSRVAPEDKLRIARALRARGHVVAMTGDGVNDGPALQEADIGIAMGRSGTDVAREAADLVLLDDHFSTIVDAVEHGRATFQNVRRFLTYHLTDNVAELTPFAVWALSGGRFPLAIGVLQVLALDIATDTLSAVALGAEAPAAHVLDQAPASGRLLDATVARRAFGLLGPTEAATSMLAFVVGLLAAGWRPGRPFPTGVGLAAASGAAFAAVVLGQAANAFACRSASRSPAELGWRTNPFLLWAKSFELVLTAGLLFVPVVADALDQRPPAAAAWVVVALAAPAVLVVDALWKRWRRARRGRAPVSRSERPPRRRR